MEKRSRLSLLGLLALFSLLLQVDFVPVQAVSISTARVSVTSDGTQGNGASLFSSISADGQLVAFQSTATNLVSEDSNNVSDIFVYDRQASTAARVSVSSSGIQGNGASYAPSISADGKFVAFQSAATNLVSGDTNARDDIFVYDRQTGAITRVSVASDGSQGSGSDSENPLISADGRYVAFCSGATNLVSGDTNGEWDIFVHDRQTAATTRISVSSNGTQSNGSSDTPSISADGRFVAFRSGATNLVSGDTNGYIDIFVHDRQTGTTTRVSVTSNGLQGNNASEALSISADGRYVAFHSSASNLVSGDSNASTDVFIRDRQTNTTTRVSVSNNGAQGDGNSLFPSVSTDGRYVTFYSLATNLVSGDTNTKADIFVRDRQMSTTTRVSVASNGVQGNGDSWFPSISSDGRFLAYHSDASNLVSSDTNATKDVFVYEASYTVLGRIQDSNGNAISGVTVSAGSGYNATTNASGDYTISSLSPGTYTVTPSKTGYTFSPTSRSVSVPLDASGINFTAGLSSPTLDSPANSSTVTTWMPTYTWIDNPEATHFKLYLGKPDNSMIYASWYTRAAANCDGSTCHVTPDATIIAGQNKWCVKSYNATAGGAWSSWWTFNSPTIVAEKPILVDPTEGETVSTWTPTFTWEDNANATHFKLWVGKPDGRMAFAQWYTRAQANCDGSHCSVTPSGIVNPGQNRWYVKSYNPNGGAWSSAGNFTHDNILVSPADGSTVSAGTLKPTYTWTDIPSITGFYIWIGLPDGTRKFYQYYSRAEAACNNTTCQVTPDYTIVKGQNSWYIVVYTGSGDRYSDPATFTRP